MNGVMFDNMHSYRDLSLILSDKEIGGAEPKIDLLEIEGADEPLDFTEFFGDIKYNNRILKFEFSFIDNGSKKPLDAFSDIQNKLNGRKMKIILDEDPMFYYIGRVAIKEWKSNLRIGKVTIEVDCNPYKYKLDKTMVTETINTSKIIKIQNLRKWVIPTFAVSSQMQIEFDNKFYTANAGVFKSPEIMFKDGENSIIFRGNGTVKIEYQEGGL